jgi:type I restriction-modification system DNA methylase subunit
MIKRTKDRIKQFGEVFTPLPLVDEILDKLPPELFKDPEKTFLDPCCGNGNFLVCVLQRKLDNGSTPTEALMTIYGVEIQGDNVEECRERLLEIAGDTMLHKKIVKHNIVCADALLWDYENWKPQNKPDDYQFWIY